MFKKFFYISFVFYIALISLVFFLFSQKSSKLKETATNTIESIKQDSLNKDLTIDDIESKFAIKTETTNTKEGEFDFYKSYGDPYCTITAIRFKFPSLVATVYTTDKFEPCNDKDFKEFSLSSIIAQMQTISSAFFYSLNPPQLNTMVSNLSQSQDPFISIGKLRFSKIAIIKIPVPSLLSDPATALTNGIFFQPGKLQYTPFETQEDFYAYWKQGALVFGLISPKGNYYVMTSFAYSSLKNLEITNLKELEKFLSLKPGWKYEIFTLNKPLIIRYQVADGYATQRVVDEFGNYYIEVSRPSFLAITN